MKIRKIFLYDEPSVPQINLKSLVEFLEKSFNLSVQTRENFLKYSNNDAVFEIAQCRVINTRKPFEIHSPTQDEINFELKNTEQTENTKNIVMYDGFELQKILTKIIPANEVQSDFLHIFFTNKLTCTYDYNDYRYHGRALIAANPTIISTTGIIEAPAKPRQYYLDLMYNYKQGLNIDSIKEKYKGTYLEYNDPRLSKIIEGYLMQAIFYYETGSPFCSNKDCILFNAHWQKDLLHAQLESGKLCSNHQKILEDTTMT